MNKEHKPTGTGKRAPYHIPGEAPIGTRCITLQIPDSDAAVAQLFGTLRLLGYWRNYERESEHYGSGWAKAWIKALADSAGGSECMKQTKLRVDDICTLSWSYDDWTTFDSYDPSACILANIQAVVPDMIAQAIIDAINDGTLQQPGGQPSPGGDITQPGECKSYHVVLTGGGFWHSPFPILSGDTIEVTNARGGWMDGSLAWYCPDGSRYLFASCSEELKTHQEGDPLNPEAYHMAVIGNYGTTYFDPLTLYTVPDGVTATDFILQANDGSLSDNAGQVEFDVEICRGMWSHYYDFTVSAQGFVPWNDINAPYSDGIGFVASEAQPGGYWATWQRKTIRMATSTHLYGFKLYYAGTDSNYRKEVDVRTLIEGQLYSVRLDNGPYASPIVFPNFDIWPSGEVYIGWGCDNNISSSAQTIVGFEIRGWGQEPEY